MISSLVAHDCRGTETLPTNESIRLQITCKCEVSDIEKGFQNRGAYYISSLRIALFNEIFVFSMVTPEKSSIKEGANTADAKTHTTHYHNTHTHTVPLHLAAWQRSGDLQQGFLS